MKVGSFLKIKKMNINHSLKFFLIALITGLFGYESLAITKEVPRASKSMPGALPTASSATNGQLGAKSISTRESQNSSLGGPTSGAFNSVPITKKNQTNQIDTSSSNSVVSGKIN
jgi:hypothetical protein